MARGAGRATNDGASHARECPACFLKMAKQALPDSRNASGERNLLGFEQVVQRFAVQSRPGEYKFGPDHARDVRKSPSIDMEHRHNGQDHVARRTVQRIRQRRRIGVQQRRAMAVQGPFWVARRAGGVAERTGGVLVEDRPGVVGRTLLDQVFIAQQLSTPASFGMWA